MDLNDKMFEGLPNLGEDFEKARKEALEVGGDLDSLRAATITYKTASNPEAIYRRIDEIYIIGVCGRDGGRLGLVKDDTQSIRDTRSFVVFRLGGYNIKGDIRFAHLPWVSEFAYLDAKDSE